MQYVLCELNDDDDVFTSMSGWLYQLSEKLDDPINSERSNLPSPMTSYISALYFTCTSLTSVGFGNVSPNTNAEKVFSVAAMLIGGKRKQVRVYYGRRCCICGGQMLRVLSPDDIIFFRMK